MILVQWRIFVQRLQSLQLPTLPWANLFKRQRGISGAAVEREL
jgi:hypothetical protein